MAEERGSSEFESVSEDDFRKHLQETYADPDSAGRFFQQQVEVRTKALDQFASEVNADEHLMKQLARDPLGMLNRRKLLGPLDQISVEGLRNPFFDWPWPWPICRVECRLELVSEVSWVCVGIWPFRICWPVIHIRLRWVCRIVCD